MAHTLLGEKREGSARIRSSGGAPVLDVTYHYTVRADSKTASRLSVLLTTGLPIVGSTIDDSGNAICQSIDGDRREDHPEVWDITAEFSSEVSDGQGNQSTGTDPVLWLPVYETKFERLQEMPLKDRSGTTIANSQGEAFPSGFTINRNIPVWEFYQFESPTVSDETVIDRHEVVNTSTFKGRPQLTLLCTVMSSVIGFYYGQRRRLTQYALKYNSQSWTHKRLDMSKNFIVGGSYVPYFENMPDQPGGFNGSGAKVAVGDPPAVLEFDMYPEVEFSSFLRV